MKDRAIVITLLGKKDEIVDRKGYFISKKLQNDIAFPGTESGHIFLFGIQSHFGWFVPLFGWHINPFLIEWIEENID
jgi:hypothetical protein